MTNPEGSVGRNQAEPEPICLADALIKEGQQFAAGAPGHYFCLVAASLFFFSADALVDRPTVRT